MQCDDLAQLARYADVGSGVSTTIARHSRLKSPSMHSIWNRGRKLMHR